MSKSSRTDSKKQKNLSGDPLERVDKLVYLGSMVSSKSTSAEETRRRISLGAFKFHQLRKAVWDQTVLSTRTKPRSIRRPCCLQSSMELRHGLATMMIMPNSTVFTSGDCSNWRAPGEWA
ncbi:hypothetical protein BpHYR1_013148 [Brachionus plicatilis]|uniref:Uncharacterized protein n=1 Tax=Brachionus plicatilis TaxID=10195 RepID=A0A3M7RQR9_BRAPC|nr:hypothetical protein BpHYR1_013148 [Brachionus plicatilis]